MKSNTRHFLQKIFVNSAPKERKIKEEVGQLTRFAKRGAPKLRYG